MTAPPANAASAAMDRYADGDGRAFAELYDELAPRLYGWLLRRTGDQGLTEDLVQQTFLNLHRARGRYRRGADVVPWAFAVARRLTVDAYRRRRREFLWDDPSSRQADQFVGDDVAPEAVARTEQALQCLESTLLLLPEPQQRAFGLVRRDGLTLAQAAELLGISVGAVKLRLHRAALALRSALTATPSSSKQQGAP